MNNNGDISPFLGGGREVPDGDQVMFVQHADNGTLSQTINGLVDGDPYMLIFYTGLRPDNAGMNLTVFLGNEELLPQITVSNTGTAPLTRHAIGFIYDQDAFGENPDLEFRSVWPDGGDTTILYDAVEIRSPELGAEITGPGLIAEGDNVVFEVSLSESVGEASYQWYYDGVELEGETDATLELLDVVIGDSGVYSVDVTDDAGSTNAAYTLVVVEELPLSSVITMLALAVLLAGVGFYTVRRSIA